MKRTYFNIEEFCEHLFEIYDNSAILCGNQDSTFSMTIVGFYDLIKDTLNCLIKEYDFTLKNVELLEPSLDRYDDEYLLTIDFNGEIYTQKAMYGNKYIYDFPDNVLFIQIACNKDFIKNIKHDNPVFFKIDNGICHSKDEFENPNDVIDNIDDDSLIELGMDDLLYYISDMDNVKCSYSFTNGESLISIAITDKSCKDNVTTVSKIVKGTFTSKDIDEFLDFIDENT